MNFTERIQLQTILVEFIEIVNLWLVCVCVLNCMEIDEVILHVFDVIFDVFTTKNEYFVA
jgi:hypothetical protein